MPRVPWTTIDPHTCEGVIAVMVCRETPAMVRVRPSRGDGGIDLIQITEAGWRVVQVKYYSSNLTAKQKADIAKSYNDVRATAAAKNAKIAEWLLMLPLEPTNENREWFDELTQDAGYPCEGRGLSHVEGLAATYPEVVDYYIGNGRERVEKLFSQLISIISGNPAAYPDGLQPLQTVSTLQAMHASLNAHDPHYRYDFSISQQQGPLPPEEPLLAMSVQLEVEDAWVTFKIYARFEEAIHERPIQINMKATMPGDSPTAEALLTSHRFGTPVTITSGEDVALEIHADLPGGLGGHFTTGTVTLGPMRAAHIASRKLRMQMLDPTGAVAAEARLTAEEETQGYDRPSPSTPTSASP